MPRGSGATQARGGAARRGARRGAGRTAHGAGRGAHGAGRFLLLSGLVGVI